jgi:hypothetical protein
MESSRDSSVWRNLAVTFGGGLALGAVGMKLTQTALRPVEAPPRSEPNTFTNRLSDMERRLERVEHAPASARTAAASQPAPATPVSATPVSATIDQKVLEAVIAAVDARLHEHAGQMDRRLADLEARMAVMQGLQEQDEHWAEQLRQEAAAVRATLESDMRQVRESVGRMAAGQNATQGELQTIRQQHERTVTATEQRFTEVRQEFRRGMTDLRGEIGQSVEARIVTATAAAVTARMEEELAPLRAEVEQKEKELAEVRQRLADSESSVLDVVLAIGEACRQAANRISGPREPQAAPLPSPAAPPAEASSKPEPISLAPAETNVRPMPTPLAKVETLPAPMAAADAALAPSIPDFLHETDHRTSWRIPLVSSVLVCSGYLFLMHYLSASLQ